MESTWASLKRLPWPRERGAEWVVGGRTMQMRKMILKEEVVSKIHNKDVDVGMCKIVASFELSCVQFVVF